jgi:hypothetical protein
MPAVGCWRRSWDLSRMRTGPSFNLLLNDARNEPLGLPGVCSLEMSYQRFLFNCEPMEIPCQARMGGKRTRRQIQFREPAPGQRMKAEAQRRWGRRHDDKFRRPHFAIRQAFSKKPHRDESACETGQARHAINPTPCASYRSGD